MSMLINKIQIMAILNVTPDSFFDGGQTLGPEEAIAKAESLIAEGAHIIDVGGESSRPGAKTVDPETESSRVLPVIKSIKQRWPHIILSVDTQKAQVAAEAIAKGADIVNDISAGRADAKMLKVVAESQKKIVLMHMQGMPENMQNNPHYNNVIDEIDKFFYERIESAMRAGISKENLILDPGIGFGKKPEHNYRILAKLQDFGHHDLPILVGASMKSLLGNDINERLPGTLALHCYCALNQAAILRVHHVAQTRLCLEALGNILEQR